MEHSLTIQSTARYFQLGKIDSNTKAVWFVFHGYAMRADEFINEFDCIADSNTVIIAPEGIHRFYKRGTQGGIGANWMTSDLREYDIENNILFLNEVFADLCAKGLPKDVQIGVLGFSQGCPTAVRWVSQLKNEVGVLIAWGSNLPEDVYKDSKKLQKINTSKIQLVVGSSDKYISSEKVDELIIDLHDNGVNFDYHTFDGGHELDEEKVRYFHSRLLDDNLEY